MSEKLEMPPRLPTDGAVSVEWVGEKGDRLAVRAEGDGELCVSPYNAWRLFGLMSVMLGLPLPKHVGKAIKLGNGSMRVAPEVPPKTLGERVAARLTHKKTVEILQEEGFNVRDASEDEEP